MICLCLLIFGKYKLLDSLMKIIVITLTISTIISVIIAYTHHSGTLALTQIVPETTLDIVF